LSHFAHGQPLFVYIRSLSGNSSGRDSYVQECRIHNLSGVVSPETYAVKVFRQNRGDGWRRERVALQLAQALGTPHVVPALGWINPVGDFEITSIEVKLVMLMLRPSDFDLGAAVRPLLGTRRLFGQLCLAMRSLHSAGLCHNDLKPSHMMLVPDRLPEHLALIDFNLALFYLGIQTPRFTCGTVGYQAPEVVVEGRFSPSSDVYSAGTMLLECLMTYLLEEPAFGDGDDDEAPRRDDLKEWIEARNDPRCKYDEETMAGSLNFFRRCAWWCVNSEFMMRPARMAAAASLQDPECESLAGVGDDEQVSQAAVGGLVTFAQEDLPAALTTESSVESGLPSLVSGLRLALRMMHRHPEERPTMAEVLEDTFFIGVSLE
jgi:serine/threonine protein kinase